MEFVKKHLRRSASLREVYRRFRFGKAAVFRDFSNPKKLWLFFRVLPYTMVSYAALANVYELAQQTEKEKLEGAFVECGVWKGGAAGVMARAAQRDRQIWLFDSFEGLPEPGEKDGARAVEYSGAKSSGKLVPIDKCVGPLEDVQKLLFMILQVEKENVHLEQGWFQDTLPRARQKMGQIALLRLDADWYESTKFALEQLYENVVPGGYIIFDDYGCWEGCKKAVDEFFQKSNIPLKLTQVDHDVFYLQKEV
jgi:O-methyltransferase